MKSWMKKLVDQLDMDWQKNQSSDSTKNDSAAQILSDETATLLFLLDVYNKHLFDIEKHNLRKTRETLDNYAKQLLVNSQTQPSEKNDLTLFNIRQFFGTYRIDEYSYMQKNHEEFKRIIWEFADQLGEDLKNDQKNEDELNQKLNQLREAVELNSLEALKTKSQEFISTYKEIQKSKDERKQTRLNQTRKNLNSIKKQLLKAQETAFTDHMTGAQNRRSFDEQIDKYLKMYQFDSAPISMIILDIDHFKKVNDTYGHDVGDFVIKECVRMIKSVFQRPQDFVARLGGEEFAILLPDYTEADSLIKCEELMTMIRKETFVHGEHQIKFTVSMGICEANDNYSAEDWYKKADEALYYSKQNGRNKATQSQFLKQNAKAS